MIVDSFFAKISNLDNLKLTYSDENINEKEGYPFTRYPLKDVTKCDKN
jgi:hypothetical protein